MSKPIKITVIADDQTDKGLDSASKGVDNFGSKFDNIGGKISGAIGPLAGVAAGALSAQAAFDFLGSAVSSASDLNETISKSNTVFRDAGPSIQAWAATSATAFGQSKQGAIDAASTFGNLFVQLGIGNQVSAQMSMQMVQLASDFASFHNADPTEVIEAQTAAFRGEYDALQRFVPTISAATVEQEAMAMSHKKSTSELTAQEKALATQSLMMKGAGDAAGDFTRTSDGLANQQRILTAEWADAKAQLGEQLLPVVRDATTWFAANLPEAIDWTKAKYVELKPTIDDIGTVITEVAIPAAKLFGGAVLTVVEDISSVITAGQNLKREVTDTWNSIPRTVSASVNAVETALDVLPGKMVAALGDPRKILYNAGKLVVQGLADGIGDSFGVVKNKLGDLTNKAKDWKGPPEKDAKLLTPAGRTIIESLMAGIDQQTPALKSQLNRLTDEINVGMPGVGGGARSGTSSNHSVVNNYNVGDLIMSETVTLDDLMAVFATAEHLYG